MPIPSPARLLVVAPLTAAAMALVAALAGCATTSHRTDAGPLTLGGEGGTSLECIPEQNGRPVSFGVVARNVSSHQRVELLSVHLVAARGVELVDAAAVPLPDHAVALGAAAEYPPASPDGHDVWTGHVPVPGAHVEPGAAVDIVLGVRLQDPTRSGHARAVELDYRVVDGAAGATTGTEGITVSVTPCS